MAGRIVVGIDGSESSAEALRWAATQARLTGDDLEVVMAWEFPTTFGTAPPVPAGYDPAQDTASLLAELVQRELGSDSGLKVTQTVVEGHPAPVLVDAARGADLLVVGSRGHGAFVGMLVGSVSEHCVSHAPCPVVVVRHQPPT
jgi:nucleotide-binding universal stress UspA family protein